jgi:hypothetical protein
VETKIGIHLGREDPLGQGAARGADWVRFFLGDPQGGPAEHRADLELLRGRLGGRQAAPS